MGVGGVECRGGTNPMVLEVAGGPSAGGEEGICCLCQPAATCHLSTWGLQAVKEGVRLTLAMGEQPCTASVAGQQVLRGQLALPTGEVGRVNVVRFWHSSSCELQSCRIP